MNYLIALLCWLVVSVLCRQSTAAYFHANHNSNNNQQWLRSEAMDGNGLYLLDWRFEEKEVYFRVTVNTRGFIGLGFSTKSGQMAQADLVLAWVDDRTGKPNVLVRLGSWYGLWWWCGYKKKMFSHTNYRIVMEQPMEIRRQFRMIRKTI